MPKKRKGRLYTRTQGTTTRYYGDFRDFADVGGKREALRPSGAKTATADERLAQQLLSARLADLEERRRRKQKGEPEEDVGLLSYASHHLRAKKIAGRVTDQWLRADQRHLEVAIQFFCNGRSQLPRKGNGDADLSGVRDRALIDINVRDVQAYMEWLATYEARRGQIIAPATQRKYLNSLSNMYQRAGAESVVPPGYNPVRLLVDKPRDSSADTESHWLEVPDAALLLESARLFRPAREEVAMPFMYPLLATFLLTGGRTSEVLGLTVSDVQFERKLVRFQPNKWRGFKTAGSTRAVPLWWQLEEILTEYLSESGSPPGDRLLFPSIRTGGMIRDIRKALDIIAHPAGFEEGEVRSYAFRHTYAAARLQTLDGEYPVSTYTVSRELGHGGTRLVEHVYGHLGDFRHRSAQVEYRVEEHMQVLGDRVAAVRRHWDNGEQPSP